MFSKSVCRADLLRPRGFGLAFEFIVGECDRWRCAGVEPCAVAPSHLGEFEVPLPSPVFGRLGLRLVGQGRKVLPVAFLGGERGYGVGACPVLPVERFRIVAGDVAFAPGWDDVAVASAVMEAAAEAGGLAGQVDEAAGCEHDAELARLPHRHAGPSRFRRVGSDLVEHADAAACGDDVPQVCLPLVEVGVFGPEVVDAQAGLVADLAVGVGDDVFVSQAWVVGVVGAAGELPDRPVGVRKRLAVEVRQAFAEIRRPFASDLLEVVGGGLPGLVVVAFDLLAGGFPPAFVVRPRIGVVPDGVEAPSGFELEAFEPLQVGVMQSVEPPVQCLLCLRQPAGCSHCRLLAAGLWSGRCGQAPAGRVWRVARAAMSGVAGRIGRACRR